MWPLCSHVCWSIAVCINICFSSYPLWLPSGNSSSTSVIYLPYQQSPPISPMLELLWTWPQKRNIISGLLNSVLPTGGGEKRNQRLVLRRAGRKCFLFQSVLYPLVIKKGPEKKRGRVVEKHEKSLPSPRCRVFPPADVFSPTLCSFVGLMGRPDS